MTALRSALLSAQRQSETLLAGLACPLVLSVVPVLLAASTLRWLLPCSEAHRIHRSQTISAFMEELRERAERSRRVDSSQSHQCCSQPARALRRSPKQSLARIDGARRRPRKLGISLAEIKPASLRQTSGRSSLLSSRALRVGCIFLLSRLANPVCNHAHCDSHELFTHPSQHIEAEYIGPVSSSSRFLRFLCFFRYVH